MDLILYMQQTVSVIQLNVLPVIWLEILRSSLKKWEYCVNSEQVLAITGRIRIVHAWQYR